MTVLHDQLAWYIGGPVLGLCVVAIRALLGERLGITGGYSSVVESVSAWRFGLDWRGFFLIGLIVGAAVYALIAGGPAFHGYGWLAATFTGDSRFLVAPILAVAVVLTGFWARGAEGAGGARAGTGRSAAARAPLASLVAAITFFATAIAVSFLNEAVI